MYKIRIRITNADDDNEVYQDIIAKNIIGIAVRNRERVDDTKEAIETSVIVHGESSINEIEHCVNILRDCIKKNLRNTSAENCDAILKEKIKALIDEVLRDSVSDEMTTTKKQSENERSSFEDFINRRFGIKK